MHYVIEWTKKKLTYDITICCYVGTHYVIEWTQTKLTYDITIC